MSQKAVIVSAKRSAIAKFGASLLPLSATEIASQILTQQLKELSVQDHVDQVIVGNVLASGLGQNVARQIAIQSGLHQSIPAFTLNQVCGSGMQAVMLAAQAIRAGDADLIIAGGTESMSNAPFIMPNHRWGQKMGHDALIDTMIKDGLWDAFNDYHMGITAENVAKKWDVSREAQDEFACSSQNKASKAQQSGRFKDEILPITIKHRKGDVTFDEDEFIRHDASVEALSSLRPVFDREGSVTAGNASGLNDGAAFVFVASEQKAKELGLDVLAVIDDAVSVGYDPALMGATPYLAIQKLFKRQDINKDDIDLYELNEAFASQAIAIQKECELTKERINVNGGAIALGHPIGASGARILVTLVHEMKKQSLKKGLASLCIGGGQANAVLLSR